MQLPDSYVDELSIDIVARGREVISVNSKSLKK